MTKISTAATDWLETLTGTRIRIKIAGSETDHRLTVIDYIEPPYSKPPIFTRHEFVEVFCVIDGTLMFQFQGQERFEISAGQTVTCASWKPHSFWNETATPVSVQLICSPAGLDDFFKASDQLLTRSRQSGHDGSGTLQTAMKTLRTTHGLEHVGEPPDQT